MHLLNVILLQTDSLDWIHPDDRHQMEEILVTQQLPKHPLTLRWIAKGGTIHWMETRMIEVLNPGGILMALDGITRDITENKEAVEKLWKSEERFRIIASRSPDHIIVHDKDLRYTYVLNPQLGLTENDMLGKTDFDILSKSEAELLTKVKKRVIQTGEQLKFNTSLININGIEEFFDGSYVPEINSTGEVIGLIGYFKNVTESSVAEKALAREKQRLEDVIKATSVGIYEWNIQTGENIINCRWAEIIGYSLEEVSPLTYDKWIRFTHPDDLTTSTELLEKHFNGVLENYECEIRLKHKNGTWIWVLDRGKVTEWSPDGKPLIMYGTHQDITDRKLSEQTLEMQQKLLEESQEIAQLGSYIFDIESGETTWTKEMYHIFALPDNVPPPTGDDYRKLIHPDDLEDENKMFEECIRVGTKIDHTHRIITCDGETRYVRIIGNPGLNPDGRIVKIVGCIQDVTENKLREQNLLQSGHLLEESQQAAHVGSYIINFETDRNYCTSELFRIFGIAETLSSLPFEEFKSVIHPDDITDFFEAFQKSIKTEDKLNLIYRIIRKDGFVRYVHHIGVPQKNHNEIVTSMTSTFQDVTNSHSMENILQSSLVEKDVLLREVHHRVKNNLAAILGLLEMERQSTKDPAAGNLLTDLGNRIKAMSTVHEKLYRSENLASIDFQDYIKSFLSHLRSSFLTNSDLQTHVDITGIELSLDTAVPCGLIVNELVTNSMKYAFPRGKPGIRGNKKCEIIVAMKKIDTIYTLVISDNGIGLPDNFDWRESKTLGLRLVRMLGEHQLGGKIELNGSKGTKCVLTFSDMKRP